MQGIVCQQRDRAPFEGLHGNDGDLGVGGAGGLKQVWAFDRRIHSDEVIGAPERIGRNGAGLHSPAPIEDLVRLAARTPGDLGRSQVVDGSRHAIGNARYKELHVLRVRVALEDRRTGCRSMRLRGGYQDVVGGQSALFRSPALGGVQDFARNHATVTHHDRQPGLAVIEDKTAGVQFIVNVRGQAVIEVTVDGRAQPWGDVAGGRARAELARAFGGSCGPARLRGESADRGTDTDPKEEAREMSKTGRSHRFVACSSRCRARLVKAFRGTPCPYAPATFLESAGWKNVALWRWLCSH